MVLLIFGTHQAFTQTFSEIIVCRQKLRTFEEARKINFQQVVGFRETTALSSLLSVKSAKRYSIIVFLRFSHFASVQFLAKLSKQYIDRTFEALVAASSPFEVFAAFAARCPEVYIKIRISDFTTLLTTYHYCRTVKESIYRLHCRNLAQ